MIPVTRYRQLLDAVVAISSDMSLPVVLLHVTEAARGLVDARYGALGVIGPGQGDLEGGLVEFITVGDDSETISGNRRPPEGLAVLGLLITDPRPRRIANLRDDPHFSGFPPGHPLMRSFLGVPLRVRNEVFGNLYLTDKRGAGEFSAADEEIVVALAGAAGVAIENARLQSRVRELVVFEDRERIARDLHDTVIQRLFATGLELQGTARLAHDRQIGGRIQRAIEELDTTIREIREVIFALQAHELEGESLRVDLLAIAAESASGLGFEPRVHFSGPVDSVVDGRIAAHLTATLREALANVVRHAHATRVDVDVQATSDILLRVVDDGAGMPSPAKRHRGQGLNNMAARARELGGNLETKPGPDGGTELRWRVPLRPQEAAAAGRRSR